VSGEGSEPLGADEHETVNRESHPSAAGPEGLKGDLGISSERHGPFDGIEGTGTMASAQGRTDGETVTVDPADDGTSLDDSIDLDKPDETSLATNVDRTVGEVQPDPIPESGKPEFDPSKNPRH
jgi:hypothetical protein